MDIYERNINFIREQIRLKQSSTPYFANGNLAQNFITDVDHFPYTRHFRGEYDNKLPVIYGRDAGWRPRRDDCYKYKYDPSPEKVSPNHCFSGACNGVKPCKPEELNPISDKEATDLTFRNRNIIDYR